MNRCRYPVSLMFVIVLGLVFIGCAKPPEAEKSAAKAAMDASMSAGAEKFATADFEAAKKLWDDSEAQVAAKKYKEAKQGYIDAKAAFDKAAGASVAGKKAMTDEVTAAVAALEEAWKNMETAVAKVQKKMKDKKDAWTADANAFVEGVKSTKDLIASDPAGAKAKAGELKTVIDKWDAAIKELEAAPVKPEAPKKEAGPAKKK